MNMHTELESEYQAKFDYVSELYADDIAGMRLEGQIEAAREAEEEAARYAATPLYGLGWGLEQAGDAMNKEAQRKKDEADHIPF